MLKKELLAKQICISRTYYFHVKKCIDQSCLFHIHTPINSDDEIERFPDPIPYTDENGIERYKEGQDDEEMFMTSKLADMTKRRHGAPFPPDKQHANMLKNVFGHGLLESRTANFNITVKNVKIDALISERVDEIT